MAASDRGRIPVGAEAASLVAAPLAENALLNREEIERLLIEAGAGAQHHSMAPPHQLGQELTPQLGQITECVVVVKVHQSDGGGQGPQGGRQQLKIRGRVRTGRLLYAERIDRYGVRNPGGSIGWVSGLPRRLKPVPGSGSGHLTRQLLPAQTHQLA